MIKFDPYLYRFPSKRNLIFAKNGMVASSSPLAAQAGLEIMKQGGNAIDAIVAAAATLTVVEPSGNGIGGDGFSIISYKGKMYGMNSSGPAPALISGEALKEKGPEITKFGLDPVTVPGIPSGWAALSKRFGNLTLAETLEPAAKIAEEGYVVAPTVASLWARYYKIYAAQLEKYPILQNWFDLFCPDGRPVRVGEVWKSQGHANTLREIGRTNAESFYRGEIADKIDEFSRANGGYIRKEDLAAFQTEWVEPLSTNYRGYDVWELPPNTHGLVVLAALNILENFELKNYNDVDTIHKQIEALKLAFTDGIAHVAEPDEMKVTVEQMLCKDYAKERSKLIGENALMPEVGPLESHGTVYLAAADNEGNMVSYIQSNYTGFGSGTVVPGLGITLHNRGSQFTLDENHPNYIKPGKRPYHTIIPGFLSKDGKAIGPFGVMGGPLQPQAHMQVVNSLIDFNLNPQEALDMPRWQWIKDKHIQVEPMMPFEITEALIRRGHEVEIVNETIMFGRGQIILRNWENGTLIGATEPRSDGHIALW